MGDPTGEDKPEPTLELPSLFRRKRRAAATAEPRPMPVPQPEPPQPEPEPEPVEATQAITDPEPPPASPAPAAKEPVQEPEPISSGGQRRAERRAPRRARRARPEGPTLPATVAAVLTGLVVGLGGALLTYAGLQGCELLRGTDSCGGPGLLLLVAILVVMVLAGATLLAWLGVSEPRSTSFLGVGLTAVVAMVALLETLFSPWMFVAVPLLAAAAYLLAEWVTTRLVEELDDGPGVDVR